MLSILNATVGVSQEFSDEKHCRCGSVTNNIILCCACLGNETSRGMLDLHFMKENISILCNFDITSTRHQHLHGSFWAQVCLKNFFYSCSSRDIYGKSLRRPRKLCFRVECGDGSHNCTLIKTTLRLISKTW